MIDYEKLKQSIELCGNLKDNWFEIDFCRNSAVPDRLYIRLCDIDDDDIEYNSLDDLLNKLIELSQPQPKFKIGDNVWYCIYAEKWMPILGEIKTINPRSFKCFVDGNMWPMSQLFPTKEALIQAQIAQWHSLLKPIPSREIQEAPCLGELSREQIQRAVDSVSKKKCLHGITYTKTIGVNIFCDICGPELLCQHESDGQQYASEFPWTAENMKTQCLKCGEFYK